jgi:hypothetical protein
VDVLGPDARLDAEEVPGLGGGPAGGRVERLDVGDRGVAGPARAGFVPVPTHRHVEVVGAGRRGDDVVAGGGEPAAGRGRRPADRVPVAGFEGARALLPHADPATGDPPDEPHHVT